MRICQPQGAGLLKKNFQLFFYPTLTSPLHIPCFGAVENTILIWSGLLLEANCLLYLFPTFAEYLYGPKISISSADVFESYNRRNSQINYNLIKLNFIWNILFYNSVIVLDCISEIITPDGLSSGMQTEQQKWLIFQRIIIFSYETFPNQELVWESYISSLSRNYFYNW